MSHNKRINLDAQKLRFVRRLSAGSAKWRPLRIDSATERPLSAALGYGRNWPHSA